MKTLTKLLCAVTAKHRELVGRLFSSPSGGRHHEAFNGLQSLEPRMLMSAVNDIVLTEIMYNPNGSDDREYLEITNISEDDSYNLGGYTFTEGVEFTFPAINLGPGERVILTEEITNIDGTGFEDYYPDHDADFLYQWTSGGLSNNGEDIVIKSGLTTIVDIDYGIDGNWPTRADGNGSSLQIIDPTLPFEDRYDNDNWMASRELDGSPGAAGIVANPIGVVINEILANSNDAINEADAIELYNTTGTELNLSNLWLTDSDDFELKYQIPNGTTIDGSGYLAFDQISVFNPGGDFNFGISSAGGDQVSLMSAVPGQPILFVDTVVVGATETSVSIGRLPDGMNARFTPLAEQSFGSANLAHKQSPLVISEIMYNPMSDNDDHEYIEIHNQSDQDINIDNWQLRQDIDLDFPSTILPAGERMIITRFDPNNATYAAQKASFEAEYGIFLSTINNPGLNIVKAIGGYGYPNTANPEVGFSASMSNRTAYIELQEIIAVSNVPLVNANVIRDHVDYEDRGDWPGRADGDGASLDRIDSSLYGNAPESWRGSWMFGGSPGSVDNREITVMINEVMAHTDVPFYDTIELYNTSGGAVNIGNWVIVENFDAFIDPLIASTHFTIPAGKTLSVGDYIAYSEVINNVDHGSIKFSFGLDADRGDELYLIEMDGSGNPIRIVDNIEFGGSFNGISMGRWPNGEDNRLFPMSSPTLPYLNSDPRGRNNTYTNGANSGPGTSVLTGADDFIISEFSYNPGTDAADDLEFVELYNRNSFSTNIGPIEVGGGIWNPEGWRLNGAVDFEFTSNKVIAGNSTVVIVGFDPVTEPAKLAAFNSHYGTSLTAGVDIVGPFEDGGSLDDTSGRIELEKPDFAPADLPASLKFTPNVLWDRVQYDSASPWPAEAAGGGDSLSRVERTFFGDFASSWEAGTASPGSTPNFVAPRVTGVAVQSSGWTQAFLDEVSSVNGLEGYSIPTGTSQLDVISWTGIDTLVIQFSEDIGTVALNSFSVNGQTQSVYGLGLPSYDAETATVTWPLLQEVNADLIALFLNDSFVKDLGFMSLDGEWVEQLNNFPSGNGSEGGDFTFRINVRPGDMNGDLVVNAADLDIIGGLMGNTIGDAGYDTKKDMNGDGAINAADFNSLIEDVLKTRAGDANLDGKVNIADLSKLASNFGQNAGFANGDFNGDGLVNIADLSKLASNFGFDNTAGGAASSDILSASKSSDAIYLNYESDEEAEGSSWSHIDDILTES